MYPNRGHDDFIAAFLFEMNRQCQKLRLKNCKFINPHGLSKKNNHASASDVITLMNYAIKYEVLTEIMAKRDHSCDIVTNDLMIRNYRWENTNKLINKYFVASKTGVTPGAGPCLVSALRLGPYECNGCLIDCKSTNIRWKEMATILLW
jgi:D-alanyl-D-alanine carboxypeptidase (penicillin-binding protein 5/6)